MAKNISEQDDKKKSTNWEPAPLFSVSEKNLEKTGNLRFKTFTFIPWKRRKEPKQNIYYWLIQTNINICKQKNNSNIKFGFSLCHTEIIIYFGLKSFISRKYVHTKVHLKESTMFSSFTLTLKSALHYYDNYFMLFKYFFVYL